MRRLEEAETLFRQALKISREILGEGHPDYAIRLNNLAGLLVATGRHNEAETLYREALEVFRASLGDDHARTRRIAANYARLLRARFPDSPVLGQLRAAFGENIGVPEPGGPDSASLAARVRCVVCRLPTWFQRVGQSLRGMTNSRVGS